MAFELRNPPTSLHSCFPDTFFFVEVSTYCFSPFVSGLSHHTTAIEDQKFIFWFHCFPHLHFRYSSKRFNRLVLDFPVTLFITYSVIFYCSGFPNFFRSSSFSSSIPFRYHDWPVFFVSSFVVRQIALITHVISF